MTKFCNCPNYKISANYQNTVQELELVSLTVSKQCGKGRQHWLPFLALNICLKNLQS